MGMQGICIVLHFLGAYWHVVRAPHRPSFQLNRYVSNIY
jgi:hypothetical protein